jgi:hypothetical protein
MVHVSPLSSLCRIVPREPTAVAFFSEVNVTPVSAKSVSFFDCFQSAPPLVV